jgi:hypothetical protein
VSDRAFGLLADMRTTLGSVQTNCKPTAKHLQDKSRRASPCGESAAWGWFSTVTWQSDSSAKVGREAETWQSDSFGKVTLSLQGILEFELASTSPNPAKPLPNTWKRGKVTFSGSAP